MWINVHYNFLRSSSNVSVVTDLRVSFYISYQIKYLRYMKWYSNCRADMLFSCDLIPVSCAFLRAWKLCAHSSSRCCPLSRHCLSKLRFRQLCICSKVWRKSFSPNSLASARFTTSPIAPISSGRPPSFWFLFGLIVIYKSQQQESDCVLLLCRLSVGINVV